MLVDDVLCVPTRSGFFADDQAAILAGAAHDGFTYVGEAITPGFEAIRQSGQALSIMLLLSDGQVAYGDCAAVQYSGVGGRDALFNAEVAQKIVEEHISPILKGRKITNFRAIADEIDRLMIAGNRIHTAIRYGITQALLDAVAKSRGITMAEVIREEYATGLEINSIPMFVQSGDDRYDNVDKMILKEAGALPHGLVNHLESKLGFEGEIFAEYVKWVRERILTLRKNDNYQPRLHFDVYGTIGIAFGADIERCADYLVKLGEIAAPFQLCIEHVIDGGSRDGQVAVSAALRSALFARGSSW